MSTAIEDNIECYGSEQVDIKLVWTEHKLGEKRSCVAFVVQEDDGYSVRVANLPGVVSQGETLNQALNNIRQALELAIEIYIDEGMEIPWVEIAPPNENEMQFRIDLCRNYPV